MYLILKPTPKVKFMLQNLFSVLYFISTFSDSWQLFFCEETNKINFLFRLVLNCKLSIQCIIHIYIHSHMHKDLFLYMQRQCTCMNTCLNTWLNLSLLSSGHSKTIPTLSLYVAGRDSKSFQAQN